jgi:hypothetical protein
MQFSTVPSASFRSWQRENETDTSQDGIHYRSGKPRPIARLISELEQQDSHSLPPVDKSAESEHEAFRVNVFRWIWFSGPARDDVSLRLDDWCWHYAALS